MSTTAFLNLGTVGILDRSFIVKGGWREAVQGTVKCLGKSLVFTHLVSAIFPICSNFYFRDLFKKIRRGNIPCKEELNKG